MKVYTGPERRRNRTCSGIVEFLAVFAGIRNATNGLACAACFGLMGVLAWMVSDMPAAASTLTTLAVAAVEVLPWPL